MFFFLDTQGSGRGPGCDPAVSLLLSSFSPLSIPWQRSWWLGLHKSGSLCPPPLLTGLDWDPAPRLSDECLGWSAAEKKDSCVGRTAIVEVLVPCVGP